MIKGTRNTVKFNKLLEYTYQLKVNMIKIRKQIEDKLKELDATIVDSGTFDDNSGSDILFKINNKQYYIEMREIDDIKELIDKEFIQ